MTAVTVSEYHSLVASVKFTQNGPQSYLVRLCYAESNMAEHNRNYTLNSFLAAHRRFRECAQRALFAEEKISTNNLVDAADEFTELWEQEDSTRGKHIRGLIAEQLASL
jgi:hypothetical protein